MSKPFKTLDEQIGILKSRGLIVHDDESAKLCTGENKGETLLITISLT